MSLDFETLINTIPPPPDESAAKRKRLQTIDRLQSMHIRNEVLAEACHVGSQAVRNWQERKRNPGSYRARIALDRLGVIIDHMTDDLGLSDKAIGKFMIREPNRLESQSHQDPIYWSWNPDVDVFERAPLITDIVSNEGLQAIQERLRLRFGERYVEPTEPLAYIH